MISSLTSNMEPSRKRQRIAGKHNEINQYEEIADIQDAQVEGDSLGAPAIRATFDQLIAGSKLSDSLNHLTECALREAKASLDELPRKSLTIAVNSMVIRNTLAQVAPGLSTDNLFYSLSYKDLSIQCEPPSSVNVVGSFLLGYSSTLVADVAVEMPSSIFQSKDYINHKYHDKRLLYLLYLAFHFINMKGEKWINVSITKHCLAGDAEKPTLTVSHSDFPQITIQIIPTYSLKLFDRERLGDTRRNVRAPGSSSVVEQNSLATIAYNNGILADATPLANLQTLHTILSAVPHFTASILLLEAWSIRHRLPLSKFVFAVLLSDLITRSVVPQSASREHILRCAFNAMRSHTLDNLLIHGVRVCASLDSSALHRIADCAGSSLQTIESETAIDDPWNGIVFHSFTNYLGSKATPHPLTVQFDGFIRVWVSSNSNMSKDMEAKVLSVLDAAFVETRRISRIEPLGAGLFGLTFVSHEDVVRKVDTRNESSDVEKFKSFWGEKAELRRFRDGKIVEALVWSGGMRTLMEIAKFIFDKHFGKNLKFKVFVGEMEEVANLSDTSITTNRAISAFNELATLLRDVEGLPLTIHSVHAASPHLRRCGMYAIRPFTRNVFIEPLEIVATFESSNSWPNDAVALAASKAAFYVGLKNKLGGKGLSSEVTVSFLDIELSGFVFRLRLRVDKELEVLQGTQEGKKLNWETEAIVRHHEDIRNVGNLIMFHVCRLAKRWLNAQMLFRCLGERKDSIVELLVVSVMGSTSQGQIKSSMLGFCRFLYLLAEFPWEVCPLVVSFSPEGNDDNELRDTFDVDRCAALQKAQKLFDAQPGAFELYVAHGDDVEPWLDKKFKLERVLANRIRATAKAALEHIEQYLVSSELTLNTLFTPDTEGFDVELKLDERGCIMKKKSSSGALGGYKGQIRVNRIAPGLDPVDRVFQMFEQRLGRWALFLSRFRSGSSIFVVWRPIVHNSIKFSLRETPFCEPRITGELVPSKDELLQEMKILGQGLVVEVRVIK